MDKPRIYADLNKSEEVSGQFRVILTTLGTVQEMREQGVVLLEGLTLDFWADDGDAEGNPDPLYFEGILHYDQKARRWYAAVNPNDIRNASTVESVVPITFDTFVEYKEVKTSLEKWGKVSALSHKKP